MTYDPRCEVCNKPTLGRILCLGKRADKTTSVNWVCQSCARGCNCRACRAEWPQPVRVDGVRLYSAEDKAHVFCPYCGEQQTDQYDGMGFYSDAVQNCGDRFAHTCNDCSRPFTINPCVQVTYTSEPDEKVIASMQLEQQPEE